VQSLNRTRGKQAQSVIETESHPDRSLVEIDRDQYLLAQHDVRRGELLGRAILRFLVLRRPRGSHERETQSCPECTFDSCLPVTSGTHARVASQLR
jgi:hypothetical protein